MPPVQPSTKETKKETVMAEEPQKTTAPIAMSWHAWAENYLSSNGWRKVQENERGGSRWSDPNGNTHGPLEVREVMQTKNVSGHMDSVKQIHGPPISWEYDTAEAVEIQRNRDNLKTAVPA
jgi:hypothetical protein